MAQQKRRFYGFIGEAHGHVAGLLPHPNAVRIRCQAASWPNSKWGGGNADFELLATMDLKETKVLSEPARHGLFDLKDADLLVLGAPERSLLL